MATIAEMLVRLGLDPSGFKSGASEAEGSVNKLEGSFKKLENAGKQMSDIGKKITMGVTVPIAGAAAGLIAFGLQAETSLQVARSFDAVAESAGSMGSAMLKALQESSSGLISNTDLMKNFNLAASLVGEDFAVKLPEAFQYLGKVSASTGADMSYLLDSLVRGVGRLSPFILDNLGIQVSLNEAYEQYAESIGKSSEELTKAEQQTAVMNVVMDKLREKTAMMSDDFGSTGDRIKVAMENAKVSIGSNLVPAINDAGEALVPLIGRFGELFAEGGSLHPVVTTLADGLGNLVTSIGNVVDWLGNLSPATVQTVTDILLFVAALGPTLTIVGKLTSGIGTLVPKMANLAVSMGITGTASLAGAAAILGIVAAIAAVAVAVVAFNNKANEMAKELDNVRSSSVEAGASFEEYSASLYAAGDSTNGAKLSLVEYSAHSKSALGQLKSLNEQGIVSDNVFSTLNSQYRMGIITMSDLEKEVYKYSQTQYQMGVAVDQSAESLIEQSIAHAQLAHDLSMTNNELDETIAEMEQMDQIASEAAGVKSLTTNFANMISYAQTYDSIQKQINDKLELMTQIDVNGDGIADVGNAAQASQSDLEGLQGEVAALRGELDSLANQAALNMMQATIAIGGVTKAEAKLFFDTAVAMGQMTREGADAAYENYAASVDMMNLLELDPKTGEVSLEDQQFIMDVLALDGMTLAEKVAMINMQLSGEGSVKATIDGIAKDRTVTIYGKYSGPTVLPMAEGGDVTAGSPYMVGERGTELFVPKTDGEIIPHNKLRDLMIPYGMSSPTSISNTYNLTMPTTANAGDVRMAFELMEAWGT